MISKIPGQASNLSVMVTCGEYELSTDFVKPKGGFIEWDGEGGVRGDGSGTSLEKPDMHFSDDLMQKWVDAETQMLLDTYVKATCAMCCVPCIPIPCGVT